MGSAPPSKTLETQTQTQTPQQPPPPPQQEEQEAPSNPNPQTSDQSPDQSTPASDQPTPDEAKGEEEEEGECGFCLFMKGGGCKDAFIAWEKCVESVEKENEDIAEKCFKVTAALKECMLAHSDYYEPILAVEKAAEATQDQEGTADKKSVAASS